MTEAQEIPALEITPEKQALRDENDDLLARVTSMMAIAFSERMQGKKGFVILGAPAFGMAISVISDEEPGSFEQISESCQLLAGCLRSMAQGVEAQRREELLELIHQVLNGTRPVEADG